MSSGGPSVPPLPISSLPASQDAGSARPKLTGKMHFMSSSRTKYTLTPHVIQASNQAGGSGQLTLTPRDLKSISAFIDANKRLNHQHRVGTVSSLIPQMPFAKVRGVHDVSLGLAIATIHPKESALDVPLRLAAPESYHAPALKDPLTGTPLSARIVTLLTGTSSAPVHWEGEKDGTERDIAHTNAMRDAEMRVIAAKRAMQPRGEALAHFNVAAMHYNAANYEKAAQSFTRALAQFEEVADTQGVALCHNLLGVTLFKLEEFKMALIHHKKQEVLSGPYGRAVAQLNMGVCYTSLQEALFAEQAFSDALINANEAEDSVLITIAEGNLGLAHMRQGNMKKAQGNIEACLEHCSIGGDKAGAAVCLLLLGEIYSAVEDHPHAQFYYEHALRVASEARCRDVAEIARVSVGVARGNQAIQGTVANTAKDMGKKFEMTDLLMCLPRNPKIN